MQLHLLDWGRTIARRCLYEVTDEIRIAALMEDEDARVAGLAAKINREEAYHRMHAEMWRERLAETSQFRAAVDERHDGDLRVWDLGEGRPDLLDRHHCAPAGAERRTIVISFQSSASSSVCVPRSIASTCLRSTRAASASRCSAGSMPTA